jgi:hypothetical protein
MMRVSIALLATLVWFGCAADGDEDSFDELPDDETKADTIKYPIGTYSTADEIGGAVALLVLKSDKTYYVEGYDRWIESIAGDKYSFSGVYRFTRSGTRRYIRLEDDNRELHDRFAWEWSSDGSLELRRVGEGIWNSLEPSGTAWCAAATDCRLQELVHVACVGAWKCSSNACNYSCSR